MGVCLYLDRRQTEEIFKIHTYKPRIFAKQGSKREVYVQSEDFNSMENLTLYVKLKKRCANLGSIGG